MRTLGCFSEDADTDAYLWPRHGVPSSWGHGLGGLRDHNGGPGIGCWLGHGGFYPAAEGGESEEGQPWWAGEVLWRVTFLLTTDRANNTEGKQVLAVVPSVPMWRIWLLPDSTTWPDTASAAAVDASLTGPRLQTSPFQHTQSSHTCLALSFLSRFFSVSDLAASTQLPGCFLL